MLALADFPTLSHASMLSSLATALSLSLHADVLNIVVKGYATLLTTFVSLCWHSRPA